jgi:hypothetical protein
MFFVTIKTNGKTLWMEDKHSEASVINGRNSRLERISKLWSRYMSEETRPYLSCIVVKPQSQKARSHTHMYAQTHTIWWKDKQFMFQREWQK